MVREILAKRKIILRGPNVRAGWYLLSIRKQYSSGIKKENDSTSQRNSFRPSSISGQQNPNKEIYNRMKQEYFKGKETNESRSPPKRNPSERTKPVKESFKYRRSVTNQVKHLERVTSNEFDQFKNKVAFEKLQREIEQAKMSQESDLFN